MRRRVLVQAFACCPPGTMPFEGGEDLLGWMLVCELGRHHDLWVITHPRRRPGIEAVSPAPRGVQFEYVALPRGIEWWLRVPGLHQAYYYLWQFAAWRRLAALHRSVVFDLAHHLTYANDWMCSVIGALAPVPFVRGPGGGAQQVPPSFLSEFSPSGRVWERLRSAGQWVFRQDPLFRRGQARAHALLVCTAEALCSVPAAWQGKASLFPVNGISDEELRALAPAPRDASQPFRVLSVGKLLRLKGFSLAIKSFAHVLTRYPNAELEIIGDGPDRRMLERLIARLGLQARVRLRPWLPRPQVFEALRRCDVFLFPSLRDGGGAVVVEAMAAGKPVVCLDLGGPGYHIREGHGWKVAARNPRQAIADLADALATLAADEPRRMALGRAARETAMREYRWEALGERLRQLYQQVLSAPQSPVPMHTMEASHALV